MKINFTKKEYRLLLEALYLSDWVMHSHAIKQEDRHLEHETFKKKILSHFKEMEADDVIEHSKESDDYYEVSAFDDYIHGKFINAYEENVFWDQLIDRLAERDVIKNIGIETYKSIDGMERIIKVDKVKEYYANEFEQHGLEHVKIDYCDLTKN